MDPLDNKTLTNIADPRSDREVSEWPYGPHDIQKLSSSLPMSHHQIERSVTALENIGNLAKAINSPQALRLTEALMKLSSVSNLAGAILARDGFDPRRNEADATGISHYVEIAFGKIKELIGAGGITNAKEEVANKSAVEPPEYFTFKRCGKEDCKPEMSQNEFGHFMIKCKCGRQVNSDQSPSAATKYWNNA